MSDSTDDDDPVAIIRAVLETPARRDRVERQPERRQPDRRALGFAARRGDDRDLNTRRRTVLLTYLRQLPAKRLWLWIDALWLGCATDTQLAALMDSASFSPAPTRRGRPRAPQLLPGRSNQSVRADVRGLTHELQAFSAARRRHHAKSNRTRRSTPKSAMFRDTCLASWIGQEVDRAGLFGDFFDQAHLTPREMAVRLLLVFEAQRLTAWEQRARTQAAQAPSPAGRALWQHWATQAAHTRRQLPRWKTLLNKLKPARSFRTP